MFEPTCVFPRWCGLPWSLKGDPMPQLRKSFLCLGVISVVAIAFVFLLPSVEVSPVASPSSQPEPQREVPQAPPKTFEPPTRQSFEQRLLGGISHLYPLPMKEGDFLELIVDQKGVDVEVEVFDPLGEPLFTVDSPNGDQGPERVLLVARESARYRAQVSTFDPSGKGGYRIWIATQRRATPEDLKEAKAEELFFQAKATKEPFNSRESKLQEAARLWEQTGNDGRQADALWRLGALYAQREQHRKSLEVWHRAKFLYHEARRLGDEGVVANDIGTSYFKLSRLDLAEESYGEALTFGKRTGNAKIAGAALYNLGYISWRRGKYSEALEKLEPARLAVQDVDRVQEGKALTALGLVFSSVGKTDIALRKFREALAVFKNLGNEGQMAIALTQMGNAYVTRGKPEQAQEFYLKALEIQGRIQDEGNLLVTLSGLGLASLNQNRPQDALDFFLKSLERARKTGNAVQEARIWTNLGWTYSELGRDNDAYTAYEQALRLEERTGSRGMKTAARLGLALLEERRGNPIAALGQAESAVSSVEELRGETGPDLKIAFIASQQDVYDVLIDILLWLHELQPSEGYGARALQVSEQARSRRLLDRIQERSPALPSAPRILSLREIQSSVLGSETLLLEYHLGRRASYLWLVEETSLQIVRLPPREELEALAKRTQQLIAVSYRREKKNEARRVAVNLSQMLLGPAVGSLGRKRLLISVPAALQAVPFSVLPDPAALGPETRSEWPRPLIVNHEVVTIPSASVLASLRAREGARPAPEGLLAMLADPVFNLQDERLRRPGGILQQTRSETDPIFGSFERLTYAREEAESILGEVGTRRAFSAFGFDATRALVLSGRLRDFRNIHFATHGLLRSDAADLSALVLSQVDPRGRRQDGFLRAANIYGLELPAELVTLSACETGLGEKIPGEGLMGLPHAFFTAGATRVLVSLWAVNDLATAKLMKRFYHEYLTRGMPPAAALREAQKAMWQSRTHNAPFYWGGFELQGDWRAAESPR